MIFRKIGLGLILLFLLVLSSPSRQANANTHTTPWYKLGNQERTCSHSYYCTGAGSITNVGEGGDDLGLPYNTTVTSLTDCHVVGVGWYWGGGVVTCRGYVPYFGHIEDIYYQHLIHIDVVFGEHIETGQEVGKSNAWIEWGINPYWYGIWGPDPHPGPWINPLYSGYSSSLSGLTQPQDGDVSQLHTLPYTPLPTPTPSPHRTIIVLHPLLQGATGPPFNPDTLASSEQTYSLFDFSSILIVGGLFILVELLIFSFFYYRKHFL